MTRKIEEFIKKESYGQYDSINGKQQTATIKLGNLFLYFSFDSVIAFIYKRKITITENIWTRTTAKHLNWINPNKEIRIPYEQFEEELVTILKEKFHED